MVSQIWWIIPTKNVFLAFTFDRMWFTFSTYVCAHKWQKQHHNTNIWINFSTKKNIQTVLYKLFSWRNVIASSSELRIMLVFFVQYTIIIIYLYSFFFLSFAVCIIPCRRMFHNNNTAPTPYNVGCIIFKLLNPIVHRGQIKK